MTDFINESDIEEELMTTERKLDDTTCEDCHPHPKHEKGKCEYCLCGRDVIEIVPVREMPYEYAKLEIIKYIQSKDRKVYISELAEELRLDIELIKRILENEGIKNDKSISKNKI